YPTNYKTFTTNTIINRTAVSSKRGGRGIIRTLASIAELNSGEYGKIIIIPLYRIASFPTSSIEGTAIRSRSKYILYSTARKYNLGLGSRTGEYPKGAHR
ncbi:hypothetical protein NEUTE2DRAFT_64651, partial [Neurospora tetrasperma FGSC 2509]